AGSAADNRPTAADHGTTQGRDSELAIEGDKTGIPPGQLAEGAMYCVDDCCERTIRSLCERRATAQGEVAGLVDRHRAVVCSRGRAVRVSGRGDGDAAAGGVSDVKPQDGADE